MSWLCLQFWSYSNSSKISIVANMQGIKALKTMISLTKAISAISGKKKLNLVNSGGREIPCLEH